MTQSEALDAIMVDIERWAATPSTPADAPRALLALRGNVSYALRCHVAMLRDCALDHLSEHLGEPLTEAVAVAATIGVMGEEGEAPAPDWATVRAGPINDGRHTAAGT